MKIALVVPYPYIAEDWSWDLRLIIDAFVEAGHEGVFVCPPRGKYPDGYAVIEADKQSQMLNVDFWKSSRIDIAIVLTWLRNDVSLVAAIKSAGVFTIQKGDTDGTEGSRVHVSSFLTKAIHRDNWTSRVKGVAGVAKRYLQRQSEDDKNTLKNLETADATLVETDTAKSNLVRFLEYFHADHLADKIHVVPHMVSKRILETPLPALKKKKIVAVGRWDAPQKDARLLVRSLNLFLQKDANLTVTLIGRGGEERFSALLNKFASVQYLGVIPNAEISKCLADARSIIFTSRWEGSPVSANEALAMGCSVVSTNISGLRSVCTMGGFGRVANKRSPINFSRALEQEMDAWDRGERDVNYIAQYWRDYFSYTRIANQILSLAE